MSELYGLNYGPDFLASLPTVGHLDANSSPSRSIHTLTATQFKDLHFNHILSHPPDSVLFPFLHGIEGDNQAQNLFFATQGQQAMLYNDNKAAYPPVNRAKAPKYRGLMWVICEDDLDNPEKELRILVHRDSVLSEEQYEDSSDSYFDDEDDLEDDDDSSSESFGEPLSPVSTTPYPPAVGMDMELDIQYNDSGDDNVHGHHNPDVVEIVGVGTDEKHMHPVQHRATVLPTPIRTTDLPHHHAKSSTTATSDFSSASTDSSGTEASTALTEFEEEPNVKSSVEAEGHSPPSRSHHHKHSFTYARKAATPPPILTSTFRATDLLRQIPPSSAGGASGDRNETNREPQCGCGCIDDEDSEWEFTPLHVPEGISLRNFGIQVPILASISDIVVYSPNSSGAAKSARALKLARRFKQAVDRKRRERIGCECEAVEDGQNHTLNDTTAGAADKCHCSNDADAPPNYNVFLLDASAEEIRREMPHMVVKLCPDGQVPGSLGGNSSVTARPPTVSAVLTRSPSTFRHDQDGDVVMSEGGNGQRAELFAPSTSPTVALTHTQRPSPSPNTVDFAQREKDEMRDLTRASEIVSIFPKDHPLAYLNPDPIRPPVHIQASSHHIPNPNPSSNPHPNHHPLTHSHTHSSVASGAPSTNLDSETEDAELDLSSTKTYWDPLAGQIFLGNANDIPLPVNGMGEYGEMDPKWGGKDIVDLDSYPYDDQDSSKSPNANDSSGSYRYGFEGQGYYFPPGNSPRDGYGYDICIECHDLAPFPTMAHLKASEEKIALLEERWRLAYEDARRDRREEMQKNGELGVDDGESAEMEGEDRYTLPPRPPPHPNAIIHLPMPSSPPVTAATMSILMPIVRFLQKCITETGSIEVVHERRARTPDPRSVDMGMGSGVQNGSADPQAHLNQESKSRRWSSVSSLITSFSGFPIHSNPATPPPPPSLNSSNLMPSSSAPASVSTVAPGTVSGTSRLRAMTIPASITPSTDLYTSTVRIVHHPPPTSGNSAHVPTHQYYSHHSRHPSSSLSYLSSSAYTSPFPWTRPLKILLYSADGYTESSVPALILLMATKGLSLPQAYLDLQVGKRRSFFVYSGDLGVLRKVEGFCEEEKRILREEEERRGREEAKERERVRERERRAREVLDKEKGKKDGSSSSSSALSLFGSASGFGFATHINPYRSWGGSGNEGRRSPSPSRLSLNSTDTPKQQVHQQNRTRPTAKSVSFARSPFAASSAPDDGGSVRESQNQQLLSSHELPTQQDMASMSVGTGGVKGSATLPISSSAPSTSMISLEDTASSSFSVATGHIVSSGSTGRVRRPRASTSPWLPSFFGGDHQSWFNDPRFDGSFPSRVLPFLYLGNLAHASNVYMLQALGITHVVSVGECALVPPDSHSARVSHFGNNGGPSSNHFIPSKTQNQGSLWIEERAGRIKVLDIQGVCDDGIDTLEPQLEPICDWIDQARQEGGQVLVHCRVGVSRSATVTIAYVMKHLSLPLVDAYLIVRSRRLSVLIQPNMRLLYNLLGWEIKLAKERAGEDEDKLKRELSTALSWPFLAKEVHALNEKYLH